MKGSYLHHVIASQWRDKRSHLYIGKVAEITGATCKAIRLYESMGIIPIPKRIGMYRVYSDADVFLIHLIRTGQSLGFSLKELKTLAQSTAREDRFPLELACSIFDKKQIEVKQQISDLNAQLGRLEKFREIMLQTYS